MSGNAEQLTPAGAIVLGLVGLAHYLAPSMDLAAKSAEEDPLEHALRLLEGLAPGAQALVSDLDVLKTEHETLQAASGETDKDLADHVVKLRDATIELASLRRQVAAQKGQATKARAEQTETAARLAEALARSDQAEPRKMPDELPIIAKADHGDLLQLIGVAEKVEIVAIADDREDVGLPALSITGGTAAFRVVSSGLCLALDRWEVVGPGKITGWALYLDDDLAAYRHRVGGQLTIGAGQTFNLASDVLF